jgi:hypothetical protein
MEYEYFDRVINKPLKHTKNPHKYIKKNLNTSEKQNIAIVFSKPGTTFGTWKESISPPPKENDYEKVPGYHACLRYSHSADIGLLARISHTVGGTGADGSAPGDYDDRSQGYTGKTALLI